jgi:hypothetical protein
VPDHRAHVTWVPTWACESSRVGGKRGPSQGHSGTLRGDQEAPGPRVASGVSEASTPQKGLEAHQETRVSEGDNYSTLARARPLQMAGSAPLPLCALFSPAFRASDRFLAGL